MTHHRGRYGHVSRNHPEAAGVCDRGGEVRKHSELQREMEWRGNRLVWNGFLCCAQHIDQPHPQDRLLVLPADPVPIMHPRPNNEGDGSGVDLQNDILTDEGGRPVQDGDGGTVQT